jgi:uncharacterized repeat protein (TIGR01451 family)
MQPTSTLRVRSRIIGLLALVLTLGIGLGWPAQAQAAGAPVLITAPIDDARLVRLTGNTRPEATPFNDRGRVADSLPLEHLQLLLKRPADREAALQRYIAQLHDRSSTNFHRWLTPADLAQRFAMSEQDLSLVTGWLEKRGFTVNTVYPNHMLIDFSGTAGTVRAAFHTEIHALVVHGVKHIANMSDPQVPAALAPAVAGIVSLHDFKPHAMNRKRAAYTVASGSYLVAPADLATIYNFNPLFNAGTTGKGQTVVVIEDTDVYKTADWTTFRQTFGLSNYTSGSFSTVHPAPPSGTNNCFDPGVAGGDLSLEAILDAEWSSAAAPSAAIELASCADSTTTFGGLIAMLNLLNESSAPPAIMSISYGECEAENGATANAAFTSTYQQAVTEGVSVFVAAGDDGAASCDADAAYGTHGIGVSAYASTAYNVAVGGTDFGDAYGGSSSSYWSSSNSATYGSALSYVPEIPWNDSCASALIVSAEGYAAPYGSLGFCNSTTGMKDFLTTAAGSGGPSGCASGVSQAGVVAGTCAGNPRPPWQAGVPGIPANGVRDLPDVSLFAADGVWGHYYVVCWSDTAQGGAACTGAPSTWAGGGGTSFAAPIMAGLQALVNQSTGARQGNPNTVYYPLATGQAASGLSCNSSSGNAAAAGCVFYDVTLGDNDVPCTGTSDCYVPSATFGALSTSDSSFTRAYGAASGWDFTTGLGSVNAANLVKYWSAADLSLSASGTATAAGQLSYAVSVTNEGPQGASAAVVTAVLPSGLSLVSGSSSAACKQSMQTITCSVGALAVGSVASFAIVVQPATAGQTYDVTFAATSSNPDIDAAAGSASIVLVASGAADPTDGPMPLWAVVAFAAALVGVAHRRLKRTI